MLLKNHPTIDHDRKEVNRELIYIDDFPARFYEPNIQEGPNSVNSETYDYFKAEDFLFYEDFYNVDDLDWYEKDPASTNDEILPIDTSIDNNSPDSIPHSTNGLVDGMGALSIGDESHFIKPHSFYGISSSNGLLRFLKSSDDERNENNPIYKTKLDSKYYSNLGLMYDQNNFKLLKSENSDIK